MNAATFSTAANRFALLRLESLQHRAARHNVFPELAHRRHRS